MKLNSKKNVTPEEINALKQARGDERARQAKRAAEKKAQRKLQIEKSRQGQLESAQRRTPVTNRGHRSVGPRKGSPQGRG
jgi:peptidoglycan hydrolase CwlO-like protein